VGLDTVETPRERREEQLGGSAVYFARAASFYSRVGIVSVVGRDFTEQHRATLRHRNIDLSGLEYTDGATFRWSGRYHENMNERDTLRTDLNVLADFDPKIPSAFRRADFLFLANGPCAIQEKVLAGMERRPRFVAVDTMNLWIRNTPDELRALLKRADALVLNDSEARMLTGCRELLAAGRAALKMGPRYVIVKKGEHGALLVTRRGPFSLPAYPLEEVVDPTGAGDSFAGGLIGYLAATGRVTEATLRRAMVRATVIASFTCEGFSLERLRQATRGQIEARCRKLVEMTRIPEGG
jgi:sugar/nucleoside kinase (ribokinase family)